MLEKAAGSLEYTRSMRPRWANEALRATKWSRSPLCLAASDRNTPRVDTVWIDGLTVKNPIEIVTELDVPGSLP